jgi:hypothetical protein
MSRYQRSAGSLREDRGENEPSRIENLDREGMKRDYGINGNNGTNGKKLKKLFSVCSVISVYSVISLHAFRYLIIGKIALPHRLACARDQISSARRRKLSCSHY